MRAEIEEERRDTDSTLRQIKKEEREAKEELKELKQGRKAYPKELEEARLELTEPVAGELWKICFRADSRRSSGNPG